MFTSASLSSWVMARLMALLMKATARTAHSASFCFISLVTSLPRAPSSGQPPTSSPGFKPAPASHAYSWGGSTLLGRAGVLGVYESLSPAFSWPLDRAPAQEGCSVTANSGLSSVEKNNNSPSMSGPAPVAGALGEGTSILSLTPGSVWMSL